MLFMHFLFLKHSQKNKSAYLPTLKNIATFPETRHLFVLALDATFLASDLGQHFIQNSLNGTLFKALLACHSGTSKCLVGDKNLSCLVTANK